MISRCDYIVAKINMNASSSTFALQEMRVCIHNLLENVSRNQFTENYLDSLINPRSFYLFRLVRRVIERLRDLRDALIVILPPLVRCHQVAVTSICGGPVDKGVLHALRVIRTLQKIQHPHLPEIKSTIRLLQERIPSRARNVHREFDFS